MEYMQASEQVVSFVAVGAILNEDVVTRAGGYIVQLLPEVGEGPLMVMTERLKDFPTIHDLLERGEAEPEHLLAGRSGEAGRVAEPQVLGEPLHVGRGPGPEACGQFLGEALQHDLLHRPLADVVEVVPPAIAHGRSLRRLRPPKKPGKSGRNPVIRQPGRRVYPRAPSRRKPAACWS